MIISNIKEIFTQLPLILEYFIPGFIFLSSFQYLTSRKDTAYKIIGSVVVSYILKAICSICHQYVLSQRHFLWSERVIILSVFALFTSVILVIISESHIVNKLLLKINNKSIHDNIWHDIIDYRNGTSLRVVCDDAIYTGILVGHEEKGIDSWFVLEDYIVNEGNEFYSSEDMTIKSRIVLNFKNIKRVELYYGPTQPTICGKIVQWWRT